MGFLTPRSNRSLRRLLIDPFVQIKFGVQVIILVTVVVVAAGALFMNAFAEQYIQLAAIYQVRDPQIQVELMLNDVFRKHILNFILFSIACMVFTLIWVFKRTHAIYGPLVAIERALDQLIAGQDQVRIQLRAGDDLQQLAQKINFLAEKIETCSKNA